MFLYQKEIFDFNPRSFYSSWNLLCWNLCIQKKDTETDEDLEFNNIFFFIRLKLIILFWNYNSVSTLKLSNICKTSNHYETTRRHFCMKPCLNPSLETISRICCIYPPLDNIYDRRDNFVSLLLILLFLGRWCSFGIVLWCLYIQTSSLCRICIDVLDNLCIIGI